ncbi:MAG: hypothetical protein A4E71_02606 [Smithella sp. PtaU1.Bin162]|nr:MAG: hypothetical protein A4E71_02606 [Smithella sp. PtaU1.Bin162]
MSYPVRLKTGFFETTAYLLSVVPGAIRLDPVDGTQGDAVVIAKAEITAIMLSRKTRPGIEIQTQGKTFFGAFTNDIDRGKLESDLRKAFGSRLGSETE